MSKGEYDKYMQEKAEGVNQMNHEEMDQFLVDQAGSKILTSMDNRELVRKIVTKNVISIECAHGKKEKLNKKDLEFLRASLPKEALYEKPPKSFKGDQM